MRLCSDIDGKGTFFSVANAEAKAQKLCKDFGVDFRYIIAATSTGRFFPVVVVRNSERHLCGAIAHYGVCVTF